MQHMCCAAGGQLEAAGDSGEEVDSGGWRGRWRWWVVVDQVGGLGLREMECGPATNQQRGSAGLKDCVSLLGGLTRGWQ